MPLEALRYPVTPLGLHYLLIHYDIPAIDPASWRLRVSGLVERAYGRSLPVEDALRSDALLAWELNGVALPPQHGFPLRLVVPGWYGMASVKWLDRITVLDRAFAGYQQDRSYRLRQLEDEEG